MITGSNIKKVAGYLSIDRLGEDLGWVKPADNEEFLGWPYGYTAENSLPFIEVRRNGKEVATINALECAEITFEN